MSSLLKAVTAAGYLRSKDLPPPQQPVDEQLAAGTVLGDFVIEDLLARGGMAIVYSAVHPVIGKKAAIKVMSHSLSRNAAATEAFLHEARAINQIRHPYIVDVFTYGSLEDGRNYFVMEWLEGENLRTRLAGNIGKGKRPMSVAEKCDVLIQVCEALEAAHAEHIVHLDLKPDNVHLVPMRGVRSMVKLLDFGIAKHFRPDDSLDVGADPKARSGYVAGTPTYMSPEQAQGKEVNWASDVYSLGIMAYEMFLGEPPFDEESCHALLYHHVNSPPPPPHLKWKKIPFRLEQLLLHMLHKDPTTRPTLSMIRDQLVRLRDMPLEASTNRFSVLRSAPTAEIEPIDKDAALAKLQLPWRMRHRAATFALLTLGTLVGAIGWSYVSQPATAAPPPSVSANEQVETTVDTGIETRLEAATATVDTTPMVVDTLEDATPETSVRASVWTIDLSRPRMSRHVLSDARQSAKDRGKENSSFRSVR